MIQKLRYRFIFVAMVSICMILVVLMGCINLANFYSVQSDADELLDLLAEGKGTFSFSAPVDSSQDSTQDSTQDGTYEPVVSEDEITPETNTREGMVGAALAGGNRATQQGTTSGETLYEARYFSVVLDSTGSLVALNTQNIASVSSTDALRYSKLVAAAGKERGYVSSFRYRVQSFDGGSMIIFLDRTSALANAATFLMVTIFVSVIGVITFLLLVSILSRSVFTPVEEGYRKQKKFITNAGHELKTPLAIIDSCTDVVEMENGDSKWTSGIHDQVDRLNVMVQELITMAKMDENDMDLEQGTFSLSDACSELWEPFRLMAEEKGLDLTLNIAGGVNYYGNEKTIRQIISIVADNAMKYATPGVPVTFNLVDKNRRIRLFTENGAENVAKGDHPEFFERFYRGDESHSSTVTGYGIGLSMMRTIVVAHGGKVSASSDGRSVRIQATLPYRYEKKGPSFLGIHKTN